MSVAVLKSELDEATKALIRKHLCVVPKESVVNTYAAGSSNDDSSPILFFVNRGDYIYIPYFFSIAIFNKNINFDLSFRERKFEFTGRLFEHQVEIINQAVSHLNQYGTTNLNVFCGAGKSALATYLSCEKKLKTIVLVTREILLTQWETTFGEFSTAKTQIVTNKTTNFHSDVLLCMDTRVNFIPEEIRKDIGMVIYDECHTFCTRNRVNALLAFQPRYVVALSATPKREDGLDKMIQMITGLHNISKISTKPIVVVKYMTGFKPEVTKTSRGTDWTKLLTTICEEPTRNQQIVDLVNQLVGRKILILSDRAEHVRMLFDLLSKEGKRVDTLFGKKKSYNDSDVLIGTTSKIGTGLDEKTACEDFNGIRINTVILCTSIKNLAKLEQNVGRGLRCPDTPLIIHLVDDNPTIKSHWRQAEKWYISRNGKILVSGIGMKKSRERIKRVTAQGIIEELITFNVH